MTEPIRVSGNLTPADIKRLVKLTRASNVGPTTTYYAGVTAPVISAGMAVFAKDALGSTGLSLTLVLMAAALLAAIAGIVWYLIFMRWSYRHGLGRGIELSEETEVCADEDGVVVRRGPVETRIAWRAVRKVKAARGALAIEFDGADALIIPDRWFGGDAAARQALRRRIERKGAG